MYGSDVVVQAADEPPVRRVAADALSSASAMPELPEVEFGRRLAESVARGRTVKRLHVARDPIVFDGCSPIRMHRALVGRTIGAVHRRGKYLWFELDARPWPVFHFGMTGSFRTPDGGRLELASSATREPSAWPPRFAKIHMHFDDGGELVMTNARRLGRIRLRDDPAHEPPVNRLGFDPLLDLPSASRVHSMLSRRSTPIKALLLDQSFAAGVGNWIADEVLFQAEIDPRRQASDLSVAEARRLRGALRHVVQTAVRVNADKARFPRGWLFHRRWGRPRDARTAKGERIAFIEVGGRTTAWVPTRQR